MRGAFDVGVFDVARFDNDEVILNTVELERAVQSARFWHEWLLLVKGYLEAKLDMAGVTVGE